MRGVRGACAVRGREAPRRQRRRPRSGSRRDFGLPSSAALPPSLPPPPPRPLSRSSRSPSGGSTALFGPPFPPSPRPPLGAPPSPRPSLSAQARLPLPPFPLSLSPPRFSLRPPPFCSVFFFLFLHPSLRHGREEAEGDRASGRTWPPRPGFQRPEGRIGSEAAGSVGC